LENSHFLQLEKAYVGI